MKHFPNYFPFKILLLLLLLLLFLLSIVLYGCSSEVKYNEQSYSTPMADITIPEEVGNRLSRAETKTLPQENRVQVQPIRVTAKNVYLDKENIGEMTEHQLELKLKELAAKNDTVMRNARYDEKTWVLTKEKEGIKLNIDKIKEEAFAASSGKKIKYSYVKVMPEVKAKQLQENIKVIAKYTTPMLDRSKSRVNNIRLAAKKLDCKIIMPGEEFSFNQTTGSKSRKMGYENATIIVNTPEGPTHKKAPGGGVCQLSTTLYNAVRKCHLAVTERHEHSDEVHYVPDGKDATVMYNGADFKFVNNRKNPIMIRVYVGKKTVRIRILEKIYSPNSSNQQGNQQAEHTTTS